MTSKCTNMKHDKHQWSQKVTKIAITKARNLIFGMKVVLNNPQPEDIAPKGVWHSEGVASEVH